MSSKKVILLLVWVPFCHLSLAQNFPGFNSGNFSGALGADINPAMIADNIYKFDLTLVGVSTFYDNNYHQVSYDRLFDPDTYTGNIPRTDETRYGYLTQEIRGPSFMLRLSPLDAFAFSSRVRSFVNADDVTPELANSIADDFDNPENFEDIFLNQSLFSDANSWMEYGFTYAKVVNYQDEHFWKAGVTLKVMTGLGSAYVDFRSLDYTVDTTNVVTIDDLSLEFAHSDNFNDIAFSDYNYQTAGGVSFGLDIGIIYEKRPEKKFVPTFGRNRKPPKRNDRPYQYRIGVSLIDLGRIKYTAGETSGRADEVTLDGPINLEDKFGSIGSGEEFLDSLATFTNVQTLTGEYTMGLPTTMQVNFDYNFHNGFYLNANGVVNMEVLKFSNQTVHNLSHLTVTPRYENDIFGAYMPMYVNARGQANLGAAIRLGPVVVGLHDILPLLGRQPFESAGVYVVLKTFTIGKKEKSELECKDLYDGWKSRKRNTKREPRNFGDSPDVNNN